MGHWSTGHVTGCVTTPISTTFKFSPPKTCLAKSSVLAWCPLVTAVDMSGAIFTSVDATYGANCFSPALTCLRWRLNYEGR